VDPWDDYRCFNKPKGTWLGKLKVTVAVGRGGSRVAVE
jgi:hypothetical protein